MNRLLLAVGCFTSLTAVAQGWETRLGLNVGPLLSRSLEATCELTTPNQRGAVFGNVGYTLNREKTTAVASSSPVFLRVNQRTDGGFFKAGGKLFFNRQGGLKGFVGLVAIASRYVNQNQTVFTAYSQEPATPPQISASTDRGWSFAAGAVAGANARLGSRLDVDLGVQVARPFDRQVGYFDTREVVYFRPGIGSGGGAVALQGILAVNYRISRSGNRSSR
jgi:hypothetical protein